MFPTRFLFAFILVFGVGVFTLFLWQKQAGRYDFSFEQKEDISKRLRDSVADFQKGLAPFDKALEELEGMDWEQIATSTLEQSTTTIESATSSEEEAG